VQSAVITLAERTTRYCMIIALPHGRSADKVAALTEHITTLPAQLRKSLAWDCGKEMSGHAAFTIVTGIPVYFADPHSPWQRGTNENNGLIRYYLPKGSDLSVHTQHDLDDIAAKLNTGPAASWNTPPPPKPLDERGLPAAGQWHVGEAGDVAGAGLELAARHVGRADGSRTVVRTRRALVTLRQPCARLLFATVDWATGIRCRLRCAHTFTVLCSDSGGRRPSAPGS
jgi:hypothetical protein